MKKYLLILLIITGGKLSSQEYPKTVKSGPTAAAFQYYMSLENPVVEELNLIYNLSFQFLFTNADSCLILAKRGLEKAESLYPDSETHARAYMTLGDAYRSRSEWPEAEEVLKKGIAIYEKIDHQHGIASAHLKLGHLNAGREDYEKAMDHQFQALEIWEELKDSAYIFRPYMEIAEIFYKLKQTDKFFEYNEKARAWGEMMGYPRVVRITTLNQSNAEAEIADDFREKADTSINHAPLYLDSMLLYQNKALATMEGILPKVRQFGDKRYLAHNLINIIKIKVEQGKFAEAASISSEAGEVVEQVNSSNLKFTYAINLVAINLAESRPLKAITIGENALQLEVANRSELEKNQLQELLYRAHKQLGNYQRALTHYEDYTAFREANAAVKRNQIVTSIETKYQTVRKEKRILELDSENATITRQRNYSVGGTLLLGLLGFLGFKFKNIREERNRKAAFTEALIEAQEEERKRIARDLHDGIGQSLLVIKKQLETNMSTVRENSQMVADTLEEVRSISRDLHPLTLEKFGLQSAMEDLAERTGELHQDLFISTDLPPMDGRLTPKTEVQVYRSVQEAFNNILKHSRATAAKVSGNITGSTLTIIIQDNGIGFDHELSVVQNHSLGLRTMAERISSIGGKFQIAPNRPSGTKITMTIPLSL